MGKHIAILGGRFDPPHLGHLLVAQQVLESDFDIGEVWLMPSFHHPWRKEIAPISDRIAMLNYLSTKNIKVSLIEAELGGISYTIKTVKELKKRYQHTFFWIIGSDALADFDKWEKVDELVDQIQFIVFPRNGYATLPAGRRVSELPPHFCLSADRFLTIPGNNLITTSLSSSMVRGRIAQKLPITGLVLHLVEQYIKKHHLYEKK